MLVKIKSVHSKAGTLKHTCFWMQIFIQALLKSGVFCANFLSEVFGMFSPPINECCAVSILLFVYHVCSALPATQ